MITKEQLEKISAILKQRDCFEETAYRLDNFVNNDMTLKIAYTRYTGQINKTELEIPQSAQGAIITLLIDYYNVELDKLNEKINRLQIVDCNINAI